MKAGTSIMKRGTAGAFSSACSVDSPAALTSSEMPAVAAPLAVAVPSIGRMRSDSAAPVSGHTSPSNCTSSAPSITASGWPGASVSRVATTDR